MATKTVLVTSGTTWVAPHDLDSGIAATVVCLGGGAAGGGGRGESSLNLIANASIFINIGAGAGESSAAGDTWFNWNSSTRTSANSSPVTSTDGVKGNGGEWD